MSKQLITIPDDPLVIEPAFEDLNRTFQSQKTKSLSFRKEQLKNLLRGLKEMEKTFHKALELDLGCSEFTSFLTSYKITITEVEDSIANMNSWAKTRSLDTTMMAGPAFSYIKPEPYGVVLVMSAWNYPLYTAIPPLAQAIAAGNCVVLKPSEIAPNTSKALTQLIEKYLDKSCYRSIEGQIEVSKKITSLPWGLIIFTGSPEKGRLVAKAAANNLVPCLLELGGKSPTIVDSDAYLENAALRVTQGRFLNSGQTCVACDYVFVHKSIKAKFIERLKYNVSKFYGSDPQKSQDFPRIVNEASVKRLAEILDPKNHQGSIVIGGKYDLSDRYVSPTIIDSPSIDSRVMKEEIFGPILPILEFDSIDQVIRFINERPKPLALYYFGSQNKDRIGDNTSSGAYVVNEALFQVTNPHFPFGGVGNSGHGKYHGVSGFEACSHLKPYFVKAPLNTFPYSARYPPYTATKQTVLKTLFATTNYSQSIAVKGILAISFAVGAVKFYSNYKESIEKGWKAFKQSTKEQ